MVRWRGDVLTFYPLGWSLPAECDLMGFNAKRRVAMRDDGVMG